MTETQQGIFDACMSLTDAHVCESKHHEILQEIATRHARYQADRCTQGHQYWTSRYWELQRRASKRYKYKEIVAESWPWQKDCTPKELGAEMFACWRQSNGHWEVAGEKHRIYGADMAQGKNGIWYACIIAGD